MTVDDELASAMARIDPAPASKAALVRDLAIRGAQALVLAAAAERGFGVLHLDAHFDTLARALGFASVRLDRD